MSLAYRERILLLRDALASNTALEGVQILLGPALKLGSMQKVIGVGHNGAPDGMDVVSGNAEHQYMGMAGPNSSVKETGRIQCLVAAWTGGNAADVGDRLLPVAFDMADAFDATVRSLIGATSGWTGISHSDVVWRAAANGTALYIPITVAYEART